MAAFLLRALIILSLSLSCFSLYSPFLTSTPPAFLSVAQTLIDSNHLSMSLTLQLVSQTLLSNSKSITIFAPLDIEFVKFGQPPLSLLKSHILTARIPVDRLKALPQGTNLPTLSTERKLIITSSFLDGNLTINNVKVQDFAIYDDGFIVIYGIDEFFNSSSLILPIFAPRISPKSSYGAPKSSGFTGFDPKPSGFTGFDPKSSGFNPNSPFLPAVGLIRNRGYEKMATFLDMQLWIIEGIKLTVFAPLDDFIDDHVIKFGNYSSFFRLHLVPGLLRLVDLMMNKDEILLETFSEDGFKISVRKSGDIIVVNGVPVMFADMYCTDWLVIHGLSGAILPPEAQELKQSLKESSSNSDSNVDFEDNQPDYDDLVEPSEDYN